MGEDELDRAQLLHTLATLPQHPESVPINQLVQVPGTPLHGAEKPKPLDFVRVIAVARLLMPRSHVRLSAGRSDMSDETQALCFLAGANSIFYGDKLLTTENPDEHHDRGLFEQLGIRAEKHAARRRRPADESSRERMLPRHHGCRLRLPRYRAMSDEFFLDPRAVRRSFDRASRTYDAAAVVQGEIRTRLLERLDIVRLAADCSARPRRRNRPGEPRAETPLSVRAGHRPGFVAGDAAAKARASSASCAGSSPCAAMRTACPCKASSFDLVLSNLLLEWCHDPDAVFAEAARVLRPKGLFTFTTLGPDTLKEAARALARRRRLHARASLHRHA